MYYSGMNGNPLSFAKRLFYSTSAKEPHPCRLNLQKLWYLPEERELYRHLISFASISILGGLLKPTQGTVLIQKDNLYEYNDNQRIEIK